KGLVRARPQDAKLVKDIGLLHRYLSYLYGVLSHSRGA
ncbi:MAG: hypothetical protein ACI974_002207, partial [Paraglaciecola sp.]